jgi:hypothetical protein
LIPVGGVVFPESGDFVVSSEQTMLEIIRVFVKTGRPGKIGEHNFNKASVTTNNCTNRSIEKPAEAGFLGSKNIDLSIIKATLAG